MAVHMGKKKMVHGGKVKKMAHGGMMKEEKMMKREGRGMAKADMQKNGKKKMMVVVWLKKVIIKCQTVK
jgi:hypothetical protein